MTTHHAPAGVFSPVFLRDAGERIAATYVQAFLGLLIAGTFTLNISGAKAAAVAALPALLSAVKVLVASQVGSKGTASLDPGLATVDATDPREPETGRPLIALPPGGVVNIVGQPIDPGA